MYTNVSAYCLAGAEPCRIVAQHLEVLSPYPVPIVGFFYTISSQTMPSHRVQSSFMKLLTAASGHEENLTTPDLLS
jgi:hypothetical protein